MAELSLKKARSILKEGKKEHGEDYPAVYEGDIPDDEKKMVSDAEELVELAEEAQSSGQEHPAITKILMLAEVDGGTESDPNSEDEPWEDYDSSKIGEILAELPQLNEEELATAFEYERANKNRAAIIEVLEEMAPDEDEKSEETGDEDAVDEPWGGYDSDSAKDVLKKLPEFENKGFLEDVKTYEEENGGRAPIIAMLDALMEDMEDDVEEESEDGGTLTREALEEMEIDDLKEVIKLNELKMRISNKTTVKALRVKIADALELEWADETEEEDDEDPQASEATEAEEAEQDPEDESPGVDGIDWETLEQLELDELKEIISEKELGMRAGPKTDLDKLRIKIAEALEIEMPAEQPWRGYDGRKVPQILAKLPKLSDQELAAVYEYETQNKERKSILEALGELADERGLTTDEEADKEEEPGEESEGSEGSDAGDEPDGEAGKTRKKRRKFEGTKDPEDDDEHEELIGEITARVEEEHLSVPARPPAEVVEMPFDLTELSDRELRQMYSAFVSYFGRAAFIAKVEKQLSNACKHIADEKQNEALTDLEKIDPETGKDKTATQLKAEAEGEPEVKKWRKREHSHRAIYESMKDDCAIYSQNIESLSRDWTMRSEELEHSGGLGSRSKKKGK